MPHEISYEDVQRFDALLEAAKSKQVKSIDGEPDRVIQIQELLVRLPGLKPQDRTERFLALAN
jgi:hypothetical protein